MEFLHSLGWLQKWLIVLPPIVPARVNPMKEAFAAMLAKGVVDWLAV